MKTGFEYCYRPKKDEVESIFLNGTIILDTNVLLDVFRVENKSSQTLIKVFEHIKDRVKLPYHVVEEYHNDYLTVLVKQKVYLQNAVNNLKDKEKGMHSLLKNKEYANLSKYAKTIMTQALDKATKSVIGSYTNTIKHLENEIRNDLLINKISEVFSGKVLPPFTKKELQDIYTEGVDRYKNKVPPGYKDVADKDKKGVVQSAKGVVVSTDDQNIFGDLVIWKEILKYVDSNPGDIVFVSNDTKEDWICEICNEKHGPRIELLEEFFKHSGGHRLLVYPFDEFVLRLNTLEPFIPEDELKKAINSLDDPNRREERIRLKSATPEASQLLSAPVLSSEAKGGVAECTE